jgi:hypothetical protein
VVDDRDPATQAVAHLGKQAPVAADDKRAALSRVFVADLVHASSFP